MFELNAVTAIPVGTLAAAIWAGVSIRRLLRSENFAGLSRKQRVIVWVVAAIVFVPALFLAFGASVMLTSVTVRPGPGNHLMMALTMVFGVGVLGAAITWGSARLAATLMRSRVSG